MIRLLKMLVVFGLLAGSSALVVICAAVLYLNPQLPSVEVLRESNLNIPLRVYSRSGTLIGEFGEKFRTPIKREDLPQPFVQALLSAEDDRFMQHRGVDITGLLRAASELVTSGSIQTGGSTITMQVARNYFLTSEQTFIRKFREILLAIKIERMLSKGEILELYVNKIYLGKRAYGVQAAAAIYYGKSVQQLNVAQLAMIAGLPKAPSAFNPINRPARALERRNWILGRMLKLGYIDTEMYEESIEQPITAKYHGPKLQLDAGYPAEMARRFAIERYGESAYTDGLKVFTTIDDSAQIAADRAVTKGLIDYSTRHGYRGPQLRLGTLEKDEQIATLNKQRTYKDLLPALIESIEITSDTQDATQTDIFQLTLRLAKDQTVTLTWPKGEALALRPFVDEDRRGKLVTDPRKILAVGDIVRIRQHEDGTYKLAQLPKASASLVALDPSDGAIRAITGGFDHKQSQFNRALQGYRQPGSNFKPFIYAAAFENGFTAASIINDAPIVFDDDNLESSWRPENSSGKFYGPTTLRRALFLSRNLVSVRLLREMGIDNAIDYLDQFELGGGRLPRDLSLALGSHALTPLEVASLYAVIANGGFQVEPYLVTEIRDRRNEAIYAAQPTIACENCIEETELLDITTTPEDSEVTPSPSEQAMLEASDLEEILTASEPDSDRPRKTLTVKPRPAKRVMQAEVAYVIDDILRDVIARGTGTKAQVLKRDDIAGKTGTTNGPTDAWFSGYHPNLVATSWLGFDNNEKLGRREFGGTAALPIWIDFMQSELPKLAYARRKQPSGIVAIRIDSDTGRIADSNTINSTFEYFPEALAPQAQSAQGGYNNHSSIGDEILDEDLF